MNELQMTVAAGIFIPFLGTAIGAACVFFMKKELDENIKRVLTGFAAGVMVAASIWSLLIPAIDQAENMGKFAFTPAAIGFWLGILFLLFLDRIIPHLHRNSKEQEGPHAGLKNTTMLLLAVVIHNLPEGMAVGVVYAGLMMGNETMGLNKTFKEYCDLLCTIPMSEKSYATSFNVSCAASILMYEITRQRGMNEMR